MKAISRATLAILTITATLGIGTAAVMPLARPVAPVAKAIRIPAPTAVTVVQMCGKNEIAVVVFANGEQRVVLDPPTELLAALDKLLPEQAKLSVKFKCPYVTT